LGRTNSFPARARDYPAEQKINMQVKHTPSIKESTEAGL